jgi:hypothetical protein
VGFAEIILVDESAKSAPEMVFRELFVKPHKQGDMADAAERYGSRLKI